MGPTNKVCIQDPCPLSLPEILTAALMKPAEYPLPQPCVSATPTALKGHHGLVFARIFVLAR